MTFCKQVAVGPLICKVEVQCQACTAHMGEIHEACCAVHLAGESAAVLKPAGLNAFICGLQSKVAAGVADGAATMPLSCRPKPP